VTALITSMAFVGAGDGGFNPLIFDPAALGLTVITFLGLLVVLRLVGWKPMLAAIEAREQRIEQAIKNAEEHRAKAEAMLAEYEQRVAGVETEVAALRDKGRHQAELMRKDILEKAGAEAADLLTMAHRDIDAAKSQAIEDIRKEAVEIGMAIAGRVVARKLDDSDSRRLADQVIAELGSVKS
jgi:F-type H+-transporting ATPase subunit b